MIAVKSKNQNQNAADSFGGLMQLWQRQPYSRESQVSHLMALFHTNPTLKLMLNANPCICWVLNIRTAQYEFVSQNVERLLGYSPQSFLKGGSPIPSR